MLVISFSINPGPPTNATADQLVAFAKQYYTSILWGAWLQAVGPILIVLFAFAIVFLAGASSRFAGWMTLFGGTILMTVSLVEIIFYISALSDFTTGLVSLDMIHAAQHLYFIVGAPALFIPLGAVVLESPSVLPRVFGYSAIVLGIVFAVLGVIFLYTLTLPFEVTALAGVQVFWWLFAAIVLIRKADKIGTLRYRLVSNEQ